MTNLFILIGAILSALAVIILTFISKKPHKTSTFVTIGSCIILGAILSATGGILGSNQIEKLNTFILSSITGGDSFCHVSIGNISKQNDLGYFVVHHKGKYPMYNVQILIINLNKPSTPNDKLASENLISPKDILNFDNLSPKIALLSKKGIHLNKEKKLKYNFQITARNGLFFQLLRLKFFNNKWVRAVKVTKGFNTEAKVIFEDIHEDYPREKNGNINWS